MIDPQTSASFYLAENSGESAQKKFYNSRFRRNEPADFRRRPLQMDGGIAPAGRDDLLNEHRFARSLR